MLLFDHLWQILFCLLTNPRRPIPSKWSSLFLLLFYDKTLGSYHQHPMTLIVTYICHRYGITVIIVAATGSIGTTITVAHNSNHHSRIGNDAIPTNTCSNSGQSYRKHQHYYSCRTQWCCTTTVAIIWAIATTVRLLKSTTLSLHTQSLLATMLVTIEDHYCY